MARLHVCNTKHAAIVTGGDISVLHQSVSNKVSLKFCHKASGVALLHVTVAQYKNQNI